MALERVSGHSVAMLENIGLTNRSVDGLDPLPAAVAAQDLERRDGLTEEQSHTAQVGVTSRIKVVRLGVVLLRASLVLHVAEVYGSKSQRRARNYGLR